MLILFSNLNEQTCKTHNIIKTHHDKTVGKITAFNFDKKVDILNKRVKQRLEIHKHVEYFTPKMSKFRYCVLSL